MRTGANDALDSVRSGAAGVLVGRRLVRETKSAAQYGQGDLEADGEDGETERDAMRS